MTTPLKKPASNPTNRYIPNPQDIPDKYDGSIIFLGYGAAGTGKTEFGGSIGEDGLFISIGAGEMTLSSPGFRERNPKRPKIVYIRGEDRDPHSRIFKSADAFNKLTDTLDWVLENNNFRTVTIDDATFLTKFARNRGIEVNDTNSTGNSMSSLHRSRKAGFLLPDINDYQKEMNIIDWFLATYVPIFRDAKKNLILLAHERHIFKKADKIGGEDTLKLVKPGFTGKTFPEAIVAYFDLVWRFEVVNGKTFRMHTMPSATYSGKTRWSGVFKNPEESMSFLNLERRLKEST